ncbi:receptor-type tyrosine-protein phosphatase mu-like [Gigantopelta aegis]|uniref:receptor-type tyrosine-protein phosphatase mu-like n=1 Tax=Gigantopelta aegis TaxID=1735272 RepID=UPI001B889896|nr:receptor-type tyrosine-protein phosphatase mu-like [Gigantopelta aegis]
MYHFTTWPDHGVPSAPALLSFWKQVKKNASQTNGPITVHCSAGIGRTGTFIGLDSLVDEARDTKSVNVFECVRKMRDNRINMVQTPEQYQFLHEVLLEAISCRETLYTVASFKEQFTETKTLSPKENARLKQEFKDITSLKKPVSQRDIDTAHLPENKEKNRNQNIVPASSHRPYLSTHIKGTNDYINAVSLPSCKNKDGFLVTQMPLELTVIDFWRMVYEMECTTIVSLTSPDALATSQDIGIYWPEYGESMTVGPFTVQNKTTITETTSSNITELSLVLGKEDQLIYENQDTRNIEMFMLNNWLMDDRLPLDKYELLMFLDKLERRRDEIGEKPVVVQCIDGAKHSGLFCVLSNIISKLKLDDDVDIFVTVRELQCIRPQIVESFKQYQYCYEVVKEYMNSLEIYGNL